MPKIKKPYVNGKQTTPQPGDELVGEWSRARLLTMDKKFAERLERAFRSGSERRESAANGDRSITVHDFIARQ
jgi:hypothetical protein